MLRTLSDWLTYIEGVHTASVDLGLERVREVAVNLDLLQPAPHVIVVAGTNGKGSTVVFAEAMLRELGHRVGSTLSPHLHRFNERIRIDGQPVTDVALCSSFAAVEAARGSVPLTYFEFATLAALHRIQAEGCTAAVLEVGLGGRLDAVNIVAADVAVVTSIGLDHQAFLGDDVEQIGLEKAGIFRRRQHVVLGPRVTGSVRQRARELGCVIAELGVDVTLHQDQRAWQVSEPAGVGSLPWGQLAPENCALALMAVARLHDGVTITDEKIHRALRAARLPGRCERLPSEALVVADVAHNPAAAAFLRRQLAARYPKRRWTVILGMLDDKDPLGVASNLAPLANRWICVSTPPPRGLAASRLAQLLTDGLAALKLPDIEQCEDFAAALALARDGDRDGILICGSFAIVEAARRAMPGGEPYLGMAEAHPRENVAGGGATSRPTPS